jgi:hypothetical protein
MRRVLALTCGLVLLAGCSPDPAPPDAPFATPVSTASAESGNSAVYVAVLQRYLTSPRENSFPAGTFRFAYVLDRTDPDASDPMRTHGPQTGTPITPDEQRAIKTALAGLADVRFVNNREQVLIGPAGTCQHVPDGGVLISLTEPTGDSHQVQVGINGFVACLGATWLTYVVDRSATGWAVTRTTGPTGVA